MLVQCKLKLFFFSFKFTGSSQEVLKQPCPINGNYTFRYKQYRSDYPVECAGRSSHIDNCPSGSELKIHFRDCPFENHGKSVKSLTIIALCSKNLKVLYSDNLISGLSIFSTIYVTE